MKTVGAGIEIVQVWRAHITRLQSAELDTIEEGRGVVHADLPGRDPARGAVDFLAARDIQIRAAPNLILEERDTSDSTNASAT